MEKNINLIIDYAISSLTKVNENLARTDKNIPKLEKIRLKAVHIDIAKKVTRDFSNLSINEMKAIVEYIENSLYSSQNNYEKRACYQLLDISADRIIEIFMHNIDAHKDVLDKFSITILRRIERWLDYKILEAQTLRCYEAVDSFAYLRKIVDNTLSSKNTQIEQ